MARQKTGSLLWGLLHLIRRRRKPLSKDLDLSPVVGEFTTLIGVGQFDLQFTFGPLGFSVQSPVNLFRDGMPLAHWEEGKWPDPGFYDIMNTEVTRCEFKNERSILFEFDNGIEMRLEDDPDQPEIMRIQCEGEPSVRVI